MDKFIKKIAKEAGAILRKGFRQAIRKTEKSSRWDFVTQYDVAAENYIIKKIRQKYSRHGILAEESGGDVSLAKDFWIIDPLDGTRGFTKGLAQFCVGIAFVSSNDIKLAVVYDPMADELFFAQKNRGAYLNGKRIRVSKEKELHRCFFASHVTFHTIYDKYRLRVKDLIYKKKMVAIMTSSSQLNAAYTASGRFDAWFSKGSPPWDYAAGALLIQEAGGKVTDFKGRPFRWDSNEILAANPVLHKKLLAKIKAT